MPIALDFASLDLMDALDLAVLIEVEALERYELFAEQLGYGYGDDAASVFGNMARNEAKHAAELSAKRQALFGDAPVRVTKDVLFDVEAPEVGSARANMSALAAFQVALEAEEKARDFYDGALKHATDPEIRALFAELRDEEIEHVEFVQKAIANLRAGADFEFEPEDETPAL